MEHMKTTMWYICFTVAQLLPFLSIWFPVKSDVYSTSLSIYICKRCHLQEIHERLFSIKILNYNKNIAYRVIGLHVEFRDYNGELN